MTAPIRPDAARDLPSLHRILTPDEFEQARQLSPQALKSNPFPVLPPLAPKDATREIGGLPDTPNPAARKLTGTAKTASDAFQAVADHPLGSAIAALTATNPLTGAAAMGLMAKDVGEYAGQKIAEATLNDQNRAAAEADPNRVSGARAALDVALLAIPAGARPLMRAIKNTDLTARVALHTEAISDAWKSIFAPASRSPEAAQAAGILRATTGEAAARYEQAAFKLDEFRRTIDPLPDAEKFAFIDAIEHGQAQATPEFQAPADAIRATLDEHRQAIQDLGTGKLEHFIKDYFPHIWEDPERAATAFEASASEQAKITAGSKRPMEGAKSFLKQRTIPTTAEGIALGLKPVSSNPVDLTLLKLREMQRYLMAHQSLNEMKEAGLVKFVNGGVRPDGYAKINDNIATVFGPREGMVTLPAGANIAPEDVGVIGRRVIGEYWAPEPVAKVVNNYLSPGLRGNALYDAYRGVGNSLNQAQLGLSAFHLGFTSMDASVSRAALGVEYMASGQKLKGLKTLASAPLAPVTNARLGARVRAMYLDPHGESLVPIGNAFVPRRLTSDFDPQFDALANAVKEAGGRVRQDSFYQNSAPERMIAAYKNAEYGKAAALTLPSAFEYAARPIMEHIVPMQKLGIFGDLAQKALAELPAEATLAERRAALASAWDSVDNRMGQLVYDNLFWNKAFKDLSMASVRSVGWNIGTIRELGGGMSDLASMGASVLKEGGTGAVGSLTHRGAYALALPFTVGTFGAAYQYLRTGEGPSELKDYFYPKTGEVDVDGNPERVQLPSYMKDFAAYAGHPWETVKHKIAPMPSAIFEMLQNEDFYGDEIRNPNDPAVRQLAQEAQFVGEQVEPFTFRNLSESGKRGDQSAGTKIGNLFGITPAPRAEVRSDAQNRMADFLSERRQTGASPEDADARKARAEVLNNLRLASQGKDGGDIQQAVTDAIERGQLTPKGVVRILRRVGSTPAQERFKRLSTEQAMDVFQRATPREKALFAAAMIKKLERAGK